MPNELDDVLNALDTAVDEQTRPLRILIEAIRRGDFDNGLGDLADAVDQRRLLVVERTIKRDVRVRLTEPIRPKYLVGVTGKVTKRNRTTASVKLDETQGRYRKDVEIRIPFELLEVI